jgi:alpha-galactosidase/6-phospho-beta-glucosidase family protein
MTPRITVVGGGSTHWTPRQPTTVLEAMLADPMAGRLPYEHVVAMTDELLQSTASWLPQFAR